jgi:hypothetical protein
MRKKNNPDKKIDKTSEEPLPTPQEMLGAPDDQKAAFFPFHAINDFMTDEFRLDVVRTVFNRLEELPEEQRGAVDRLSKKLVQVPGFRNSAKAPNALKIKPAAGAFEKSPPLVAAVLSAWAWLHPELRQQVYDLLVSRGWEVLPPEADRTRLPGFLTRWPKKEDFEAINAAISEAYPGQEAASNDVSLMTVWISGRLPYTLVGDEDENEAENEA